MVPSLDYQMLRTVMRHLPAASTTHAGYNASSLALVGFSMRHNYTADKVLYGIGPGPVEPDGSSRQARVSGRGWCRITDVLAQFVNTTPLIADNQRRPQATFRNRRLNEVA